ncbi:MAG TPA: wax ester/triacylglycerol synthase family O-acyltransferase [Casimicrobiaceae bacterium]|nr:wax ester/triacylglycerol synthase family O-acyltransferase [Casimicrobiaceae bacterium]
MVNAAPLDKMSSVDTAWLRMDRPHNLMAICGVLMLDGPLDIKRLRRVVEERFLAFPRFRQRAVERPGFCVWQSDRRFDLDRHLVTTKLSRDAGPRELQSLVAKLIATPLDRAHPMWQFHCVQRYRGGSAIIARMHHSFADGIALVRVMLSMTDSAPEGPAAMPMTRPQRTGSTTDGEDVFEALARPVTQTVRSARDLGATLITHGAKIWRNPDEAIRVVNHAKAFTAEIAKLALMREDSPTRFKGKPGTVKRVAWADPLPLDDVKTIGKALAASVNDVLLACVAGALRSYLRDKGEAVDGLMIRALVPVNLRTADDAWKLGNRFGLVFLDLPVGIENPIERLYALRRNMDALKGSPQPLIAMGLLAAMGAGPRVFQETLLTQLARKATAVMTNVPGPQQPLYLAGSKIDRLLFWVPQSGNLGIGVSILSYNGEVQFGLVTDERLCPDPQRIIARFATEFENLVLTTLMAPWPREGQLQPATAEALLGT